MTTQTFVLPDGNTDMDVAVATRIPDALRTLQNLFAGDTAPASPVAFQLWAQPSTGWLWIRNSLNSAWLALLRIEVPGAQLLVEKSPGDVTASVDVYLCRVPSARTVTKLSLVSSTATTSDGSNKVAFQLRNLTAANNLFATAPNTDTAELVADTAYDLTPDQNLDVDAGDVLELQITYTGAPGPMNRFLASLELQ